MSVAKAFEAARYTGHVAGQIRDAVKSEPLTLFEISERIGRPQPLVLAVARLLQHGGLLTCEPGPDHVFRWRLAR